MADKKEIKSLLKRKLKNLSKDEKQICFRILDSISEKDLRGKSKTWAAAVYYTYCIIANKKEITRKDISKLFKSSGSAFGKRHKEIIEKMLEEVRRLEKEKKRLEVASERLKKELEEYTRNLTHDDFAGFLDKLRDFTDKKFPKEFKKAAKEFSRKRGQIYGFSFEENTIITENEIVINEMEAWYLFDREVSETSMTPVENYYEEFKQKEIPIIGRRVLEKTQHTRRSFFQVIQRKGKDYKLKDLMADDEILLKTVDMKKIDKGTVIYARLVPLSGYWVFYGVTHIILEEQVNFIREHLISKIEKFTVMNTVLRDRVIEYFGKYDPEFKDVKEIEEKFEEFGSWIKKKHGKDFTFKNFPKSLDDCERIGMVATERGINFIPYYGYIKDIFSGEYDKVPSPEELFDFVIKENSFIADQPLKLLLYSNKDSAIKAFNRFLGVVKNFDDVMKLVERWRPNIHTRAIPPFSMMDVNIEGKEKKDKKVGRNDPCPCGSGKKYKKCCMVV